MSIYDVIVVGAGPAGCAAAYHASRAGARTLILDRSPFPRAKTCGDGLSPRSCDAIARMGVRDLPDRTSRGVRVVSDDEASIDDAASLTGGGYKIVPRYVLDQLLLQQAIAAGAKHWTADATSIKSDIGSGVVEVEAGRQSVVQALRARRVVCATGYRGARKLIAGYVSHASAWAVAARTYVELRDDVLDLEVYLAGASPTGEALGYGWVFPSFGGRANVGVGVLRRPGIATPRPERLVAEFLESLRARRPHLGFAQVQGVDVAPIPLELSRPSEERGVVIAGDAAGLAHPLTAEGISAALESGEAAARAVLSEEVDAGAKFRRRLADANPLSFATSGRVGVLHEAARVVVGRGRDALTHPTPGVGTSLRRILLRATPRPVYLRAAANAERDALVEGARTELVAAVAKLNPFLGEILRDFTHDPRAAFGRRIELGLRSWAARDTERAMPPSRVSALASMEALALVMHLHDDLADCSQEQGWGSGALSMVLIDILNAYVLRAAYAQPRGVCRTLAKAAEATLRYGLHAALDAAEAERRRMQGWLTLYQCSAALGTRNARHAEVSQTVDLLASELAAAASRAAQRRLEPAAQAEHAVSASAS